MSMLNGFMIFFRAIDLYRLISKFSDWPLGSCSLKAIVQYLGFKWRDESPSGALSIHWYNGYLKTGDKKILERTLLYNEDNCVATMVIKDALVKMGKETFN
jgi:predicted RecB family nuclease